MRSALALFCGLLITVVVSGCAVPYSGTDSYYSPGPYGYGPVAPSYGHGYYPYYYPFSSLSLFYFDRDRHHRHFHQRPVIIDRKHPGKRHHFQHKSDGYRHQRPEFSHRTPNQRAPQVERQRRGHRPDPQLRSGTAQRDQRLMRGERSGSRDERRMIREQRRVERFERGDRGDRGGRSGRMRCVGARC